MQHAESTTASTMDACVAEARGDNGEAAGEAEAAAEGGAEEYVDGDKPPLDQEKKEILGKKKEEELNWPKYP